VAERASKARCPGGNTLKITAANLSAKLKKEADDYAALIVAPDEAISHRVAAGQQLRGAYAALDERLQEVDDLMLPLRKTTAGAALVAAYKQARTIHDRGRGPGEEPGPPTPPTPPTP
jgi:hypothetical protein